jgi:uncharacterized protein YbjT (DUF2867 family)
MYVVIGATGNTGRVITERLLTEGQRVRAIARNPEHLKPLAAKGAEPFVADVTDTDALTKAFTGTDAVYAMIPPNLATSDVRAYQDKVVSAIAGALEKAGVKHSVALSSFGADKPDKTGPVVGLQKRRSTRSPALTCCTCVPVTLWRTRWHRWESSRPSA